MFELTDSAKAELDAYFEGKEQSPVRVYLAPGGCSGPRLALALDAPNGDDKVFEEKGYTFCMHADLFAMAGGIRINFDMGFSVESETPLGGGGGCGSGGGSCCSSGGGCCSGGQCHSDGSEG